MNSLSFLGIIIFFGFFAVLQGNDDKSKPCEGEVFTLVCSILQTIKRNIDASKERVDDRLKEVETRQLVDVSEVKHLTNVVRHLFTKHAADITKLTNITNVKVTAISNLLKNRIRVTEHQLNAKMEDIIRLVKTNVTEDNKHIGERIDKITEMRKNDTIEMKRLIEKQVSSIYQNHADDISKVTRIAEEQTIAVSHLLINRIHVTRREIDQNINKVVKLVEDDTKKIIQINERIAAVKRMRRNDTEELIREEVGNLSSIHAADIRKLNKTVEVGLREAKRLLEFRIQELQDTMEQKTKEVVRSFDEEYDELIYILKKTNNNTVINKKGITEMKLEIEDNKKASVISRTNQSITIMEDVSSKLHTMKEEFLSNISEVTSALMKKIDQNNKQLTEMRRKLEDRKSVKWPPGHYCILSNDGCPTGFTFSSGYMKGISLASSTSWYIKQAKFGSSEIKCHGKCGHYGSWIGELYIATCCK